MRVLLYIHYYHSTLALHLTQEDQMKYNQEARQRQKCRRQPSTQQYSV